MIIAHAFNEDSPNSSFPQKFPEFWGHPACCVKGQRHLTLDILRGARCLHMTGVCCERCGECGGEADMLKQAVHGQ